MTPRAVLEKLAAIQTLDVWLPTTDGRHLVLPGYTEPEIDLALLLHQLKPTLPSQPLPRLVGTPAATTPPKWSADLDGPSTENKGFSSGKWPQVRKSG